MTILIRYILTICFALGISLGLKGQLECNGSIYRVIEKHSKTSTLQKVIIDKDGETLQFEDLADYEGHELNAICFKPEDKSIYGIKYGDPYQLFRISDDLKLQLLRELPLPTNLSFVAADIMPDGQHMVALGFGDNEHSNVLALIDLDDPEFKTTIVPLESLGQDAHVVCADIAFHPTTGLLYGFDQRSNKFIQIDIDNRSIHLFENESANYDIGVVPSMFFGPNGALFGFSLSQEERRLIQFDVENGLGEERFKVDLGGNQDACSCPYELEMYMSINNDNQYTCTESQFTLKIVNRTPVMQQGMTLVDSLPAGMTLKSIDYNPFNSTSNLSAGSNVLALTNFDIPIGEDSIVYSVTLSSDIPLGYHRNQAWLIKENPDLRSNLKKPLPSDDPETPDKGDPTGFILEDLTTDAARHQVVLCEGEDEVLEANIHGIDEYVWSTGEHSSSIQIDEAGLYEVELSTSCGKGSIIFDVSPSFVSVDLGEDMYIDVNETIELLPEIENSSDDRTLIWKESNDFRTLACYTCQETSAVVPVDMEFEIVVLNDDGCTASDKLAAYVEKPQHYFPTGFSPNEDGINDIFYLQSKKDYAFKDFMIFDRWGNRIFMSRDGIMNNPSYGWDGKAGSQALKPGVFVWSAKVIGFDGQVTEVHGDITLVR